MFKADTLPSFTSPLRQLFFIMPLDRKWAAGAWARAQAREDAGVAVVSVAFPILYMRGKRLGPSAVHS